MCLLPYKTLCLFNNSNEQKIHVKYSKNKTYYNKKLNSWIEESCAEIQNLSSYVNEYSKREHSNQEKYFSTREGNSRISNQPFNASFFNFNQWNATFVKVQIYIIKYTVSIYSEQSTVIFSGVKIAHFCPKANLHGISLAFIT